MNRLKASVIDAKSFGMEMLQSAGSSTAKEVDNAEVNKLAERMDMLNKKMKIMKDTTAKQSGALSTDSQSYRLIIFYLSSSRHSHIYTHTYIYIYMRKYI